MTKHFRPVISNSQVPFVYSSIQTPKTLKCYKPKAWIPVVQAEDRQSYAYVQWNMKNENMALVLEDLDVEEMR